MISEGCKKHGMTLLYHNHDFEFAKTPDGTYALDQLYAEGPADVLGAEPDTCWIKVANGSHLFRESPGWKRTACGWKGIARR